MGVRWSFEATDVVEEKDERLVEFEVAFDEARVEDENEGLGGEIGAGAAPVRGGERGDERGRDTGSVGRSSSRVGGVEGGEGIVLMLEAPFEVAAQRLNS